MGLEDMTTDQAHSTDREYVRPTKEEFEACLEGAEGWWFEVENPPAMEYVYDSHSFMPEHNGIVLRIFSTIDRRDDRAREKGADAIRLVAWHRHLSYPLGGREKTLRIKTWCTNLRDKIESMMEQWEDYVTRCNECGGWMVVRDGKHGKFLGCSNYPDCDHTEEYDG